MASRGTVKTSSSCWTTISTCALMPMSRPESLPFTLTVAPKEPFSLATGSMRVSVPLMAVSPVASLVMLHCMPVESLLTELAGIVTSTVREERS